MNTIMLEPTRRAWRQPIVQLLLRNESSALVFLVVLIVGFSLTADGFLSLGNLGNIAEQVSIIGILALGLNQVVLTSEIDISVGSSLAITASIAATAASEHGSGLIVTTVLALAVAGVAGSISGALVVWARIPSIIVTLGMLNALRGLNNMFNGTGIPEVPDDVRVLGQGRSFGVSNAILVYAVCCLIALLIERNTNWGRNVPAVGSNPSASRVVGLPARRITFIAFVFAGLCVGVGSIVYIGQLGAVQPAAGMGLELQVIAAVVVGGKAIKATLEDEYPDVKIQTVQPGEGDTQKSYATAKAWLQTHPDTEGVLALDGNALQGVAQAIDSLGKNGKVKLTGIGVPSQNGKALKDGIASSFYLYDAPKVGYAAIETLHGIIAGDIKPGSQSVEAGDLGQLDFVTKKDVLLGPPQKFTKENVDQFDF